MPASWNERRALADRIVRRVVRECDAGHALRRAWQGERVSATRVRVIAIGKASLEMAAEAVSLLGASLISGVVTAVPERMGHFEGRLGPLRVLAADHPSPTARNIAAAREVEREVRACAPDEMLVLLISGGGSAHLTLPVPGVTFEAIGGVSDALMRAGATIGELNTVRKHVELLKGGRLAAKCAGAIEAFVLSDVVGDRLDVIASGPAAPDPTTYAEAIAVMRSRGAHGMHAPVDRRLAEGAGGLHGETPKPGDPVFARVRHTVIASNRDAVGATVDELRGAGVAVLDTRVNVEGEAAWLGRDMARRADELRADGVPIALVAGGEWTVTVGEARGGGGPSQEFALAAAVELESLEAVGRTGAQRMMLLAFSTDGRDGPTDAAGGVVDGGFCDAARRGGCDPRAALADHDSHRALEAGGGLLTIGTTGTNVNHVALAVRWSG